MMTINLWVYCVFSMLIFGSNPAVALAQFGSGFENNSMSGAAVAIAPISFAISSNPALLNGTAIHWYMERPFGIRELQNGGFAGVFTRNNSSFGTEFMYSGFDLYKEMKILLGSAYSIGKIRLGFSIGSEMIDVSEYGYGSKIIIGFGYQASISESLSLGGSVNQIPIFSTGDIMLDHRSYILSGFSLKILQHIRILGALNLRDQFEANWIWAISTIHAEKFKIYDKCK